LSAIAFFLWSARKIASLLATSFYRFIQSMAKATKHSFFSGSRTPWSKERGGPDSGTEPYEARVSRTVPLRRL
jgi:hypothetical protein